MYYLNPRLVDLVRIFDQNERSGYLRLDLNENPGGLPEDLVRSVLDGITPEQVAQYPETRHFQEVLADYLNTDPECLCVTNGSAEAIRYIIEAFTSEGGVIVGVDPSYFMFQVYAEMYGRKFQKVSYNSDCTMDVNKIIGSLTDDVQLLVLVNPNNPMGNVYTEEEFERILAACRERQIMLLVDEAYHYFYPKTFIRYALTEEHVLVTRTFSKLFSMAGCRLGYVAGHPNQIKYVQKLCTPHNTNVFALKIAEAILSDQSIVSGLIDRFMAGRNLLVSSLDEHGYRHQGEAGNFLFIGVKTDAQTVVQRMKDEKKILIKSYDGIGDMGKCLRVSIGEAQYMQRFVDALYELDK